MLIRYTLVSKWVYYSTYMYRFRWTRILSVNLWIFSYPSCPSVIKCGLGTQENLLSHWHGSFEYGYAQHKFWLNNKKKYFLIMQQTGATSKASDQPAHMRSLIRAFVSRLNILWLLSYWLNNNVEFLSLQGASQARLSLHLSKCHIVGNHVSRLNYVVGA